MELLYLVQESADHKRKKKACVDNDSFYAILENNMK